MGDLKCHSLRDKIASKSNLHKVFKKVKRSKGVAGIDRVTIEQFESNLEENIKSIHKELMNREYRPKPIQRRYIPKEGGKKRPLGISVVRDRVIQQAFKQVLEPIFEPQFHPCSYGYRPKRGCHDAIKKVAYLLKKGYRHVVDADIEGFFDNIDHDLIMRLVRQRVSDGWVLRAIGRMLKAQIVEDGEVIVAQKGTPQGSGLSPLLANIVLNELDWKLEQEGVKFVRYADDSLCLARRKPSALQEMALMKRIVEEELFLKLSMEKTTVTDFWRGFSFLGYKFRGNHLGIKDKSLKKFKEKVRVITRRNQNSSNRNIRQMIEKELNPVIRGFANYYKFAEVKTRMKYLDCWVRMRIRAMKYKRISPKDNYRLRNKRFRKWKMIFLSEVYQTQNAVLRFSSSPIDGATSRGG